MTETIQFMTNNATWIVPIIVAFIGLIGVLIKRNSSDKKKNNQIQNQIVNIKLSKESNPNNVNNTTSLTKDNIQILFVDDDKFKTVDNLKNAGFINTKTIKDIKNLDSPDVINSDIIFVDINGVGSTLFPQDEGLGLAEALKKKYPLKYIIIYSAQEHGNRFHKALKIVDNFLYKNAEPYEFINIIENYIDEISNKR